VAGGEPELARNRLDLLKKTAQDLSDTMALLRTQSANRLDSVERLYNETKDGMGQADRDAMEQKIAGVRGLIASGQYVNSLKLGSKIIEDIQKTGKKGADSLLLLGITAVAILAVIAVYIIKQREERKPGGENALKRLERADEGAGQAEKAL